MPVAWIANAETTDPASKSANDYRRMTFSTHHRSGDCAETTSLAAAKVTHC